VNQILHISLFNAPFRFELAFGVNMKVLDNFVSVPMAFVTPRYPKLNNNNNK